MTRCKLSERLLKNKVNIGLFLLIIAASPWAKAYADTASPEQEPQRDALKVLQESMVTVSSKDRFEDIPPHVVYQSVFATVLADNSLFYQFSRSDQEILKSIPGRSNPKFANFQLNILNKLCYEVDMSKQHPLDRLERAHLFSDYLSDLDGEMDNMVLDIVGRLSERGRSIVEEVIDQHVGLDSFRYMYVDVDLVYSKSSEIVDQVIDSNCDSMPLLEILLESEPTFLVDEVKANFYNE